MSRRILHWHSGIAFFGLITFAASPALPREHFQAPDALAMCWQDLAAEDAEIAYRASWRFVRDPESAVKLLGERLKAAEEPDLKQIQAWLGDLSNETFEVRDRASNGLVTQGELAELPLRKALETKLDLETRRRVEFLLSKLEQPVTSPEKLRQIRAVEVLEMLPSPQARELLQLLATGYPGHHQTRQAKDSLLRLKQRGPVPERWLAWTKSPPPAAGTDNPMPFGARARLGTTLFRHQSHGWPSSFSPDSRLVISHDQNAVYLWETQTGKLQRRFEVAVACLAVAPNDTLLAIGQTSKDQKSGAVACWNWQTGKELSRLEMPPGVIPQQLAFSPDGAKVFCQSSDDNLRAWDIKSGEETSLWQPADKLQKLYGFSPDATVIVFGSRTDNYVLDLKKNQKLALPAMERAPRHVAFSPDARCVAISSDSSGEGLKICDATTGKLLWRTGDGIGSMVYSARFSSNGKVIAVGSYRQGTSLWNVQTGKFLRGLPDAAYPGAFSPDGRWLASAGQTLGVWNLETGQRVAAGDGHSVTINGLAFSPRYDWIATFDYTKVRFWDPATGKQNRLLDMGGTFIRCLAVSPDGQLIAAGQPGPGEGFIKVWETATGCQIYKLPGHAMRHYGRDSEVHFSPDGRFLFSWGDDRYLRKWDVKTGKALLEVLTQAPGVEKEDRFGMPQVQHGWTSQFDRFLMLEPNGDLHTFDLNTGKEGPIVNVGATSFTSACAFSPTAKHVAYGGDFDLAVRDTTSGRLVFAVAVPGRPRRLLFSPDGRTLAAALDDRIVVFEIATGKMRMTFGAKAQALTFSADGRFLATAMPDTTSLLWDLALLAEASKK